MLTKEEVGNLFYKHKEKPYFKQIEEFMTAAPSVILVLANSEDSYMDSNGIEISYESPVKRWKIMIGDKDPSNAAAESLRKVYGKDIIRNGFHGSDSGSDAYRELSNFQIDLPVLV